MPAGQGKDAERFAAAVDAGTPPAAADDAELARDLEIVEMLRSRAAAYAPDPDAKARAKERLMAALAAEQGPGGAARSAVTPPAAEELTAPIGRLGDPGSRADEEVDPSAETALMAPVTARLETEPDAGSDEDAKTTVAAAPSRPVRSGRKARHRVANRPSGGPRSSRRPAATGLRRRALLVASATMAAMVVIAGGGVFASRDALPGDNLYPVKQVAETAGLALTFDDASRARRHLEIAATRLSEVEQLAARDAASAPAPEVVTEAMEEFDTATDEGSRLLLESSAEPEDGSTTASDLRTWAARQSERLSELRAELPEAKADESMRLLDRLLARTGGAVDREQACEDDECDSDSGSAAENSGSRGAEPTEDATATSDKSDSPDASETNEDEPSRTPTPTRDDQGRLLPNLLPDRDRDGEGKSGSETTSSGTTSQNEDTTANSESDAGSDDKGGDNNIELPLPLLPPVTLPPLLPGMPGITLG